MADILDRVAPTSPPPRTDAPGSRYPKEVPPGDRERAGG